MPALEAPAGQMVTGLMRPEGFCTPLQSIEVKPLPPRLVMGMQQAQQGMQQQPQPQAPGGMMPQPQQQAPGGMMPQQQQVPGGMMPQQNPMAGISGAMQQVAGVVGGMQQLMGGVQQATGGMQQAVTQPVPMQQAGVLMSQCY